MGPGSYKELERAYSSNVINKRISQAVIPKAKRISSIEEPAILRKYVPGVGNYDIGRSLSLTKRREREPFIAKLGASKRN